MHTTYILWYSTAYVYCSTPPGIWCIWVVVYIPWYMLCIVVQYGSAYTAMHQCSIVVHDMPTMYTRYAPWYSTPILVWCSTVVQCPCIPCMPCTYYAPVVHHVYYGTVPLYIGQYTAVAICPLVHALVYVATAPIYHCGIVQYILLYTSGVYALLYHGMYTAC